MRMRLSILVLIIITIYEEFYSIIVIDIAIALKLKAFKRITELIIKCPKLEKLVIVMLSGLTNASTFF